MKNLSFIFLAATMLLSTANSFASEWRDYPWTQYPGEKVKLLSNEEFFSKSDYIFEVKFTKIDPLKYIPGTKLTEFMYPITYDAGGNDNPDEIYTSGFAVVTRVYKNDETMSISPGDTISIISKGGRIFKPLEGSPTGEEGTWIKSLLPVNYDTGEVGHVRIGGAVSFMKKSDFPENPDISKRNKYPKISPVQDIRGASLEIEGDEYFSGKVSGLNGLHFDNRYELYKYMA